MFNQQGGQAFDSMFSQWGLVISGADCEDLNVELPTKTFHQGGSEGRIHITDYVSRWSIVSKVSPFRQIYNMWNFVELRGRVTIKFATSHNVIKLKE